MPDERREMLSRAGPHVIVRRARSTDVSSLVDLLVAVAAEGRWIGREDVDRQERHAHLVSVLGSDDAALFVAESAGEAVGHLGVDLRPYGVAEVGMMVAAGWRRRGVGTALLEAAIDWTRQAGAHKIALQLWPHNEAAARLYRKFGFVEEGRLRRHYRRRNGELWDAIVMGLLLDDPEPTDPD